MEYIKICKFCNKEFSTIFLKQIYCSIRCGEKTRYQNNIDKYIANAKKWRENNIDKSKKIHKKALLKFKKTKPNRYKELMRRVWVNNRYKYKSRDFTNRIIKKNPNIILKRCKKCNSIFDLEIHHEIYPVRFNEVRIALREGKIYFLCSKCHTNIHHPLI